MLPAQRAAPGKPLPSRGVGFPATAEGVAAPSLLQPVSLVIRADMHTVGGRSSCYTGEGPVSLSALYEGANGQPLS